MATREDSDVTISLHGGASIVQCKPEFSLDSKYLLCSSGHVIKVFSVRSGECVHVLKGHKAVVTGIRLNPTNPYQVLSCSHDKTVIKWDYRDGIHVKDYMLNFPVCALFTAEASSHLKTFAILKKSNAVHHLVAFNLQSQSKDVTCEEILLVTDQKFHTAVSNNGDYVAHINRHELTVCRFGIQDSKKTRVHTHKDTRYKAALSELTCVECHPTEQCVATGVRTGQIILWYKIFSSSKVVKNIQHWHSLAVQHLTFSAEGSYMLSGGHECVLVKWQWESQQKDFLPRLGSPIISVTCSCDNTQYALCHMENGIQVVSSNLKLLQSFHGLNQAHIGHYQSWKMPAGLHVDPKTNTLVANGRPGHLQFYDVSKDRQLSMLDIVGQNYTSPENLDKPLPITYVQCVDFSDSGDWLGTVECWDNQVMAPEIKLKFWVYVPTTKGYKLNTLVDMPHNKGVTAFKFQPRPSHSSTSDHLMAVTASTDGYFKLWALVDDTDIYRTNQCWSCDSVGFYRDRPPTSLDFSEDGTILAVAFKMTLTLWDPATASMQATYTMPSEKDRYKIGSLVFGRGSCSHYIIMSSGKQLYAWNILTCSVAWCTPVEGCLIVQSPLSEHFAAFSSRSLKVYTPSSSEPVYKKSLPSYKVKAAVFIPQPRRTDASDSGPLAWQKDATLYFMNSSQELLTLAYTSELEERRQTVEIASQSVPQTPFSLLFNDKRKQGFKGHDSQRDLIVHKRLQGQFLKEMLGTPAHVMPPMTVLAMSFMSSLAIKCERSMDVDEEENDEDFPSECKEELSGSDTSDSEMEVDQEEKPNKADVQMQQETQTKTAPLHEYSLEYDKLKPKTFKWL